MPPRCPRPEPAVQCCCGASLQTGVYVIAAIDILYGVAGIASLVSNSNEGIVGPMAKGIAVTSSVVAILVGIAAYWGFEGARRVHAPFVNRYWKVKAASYAVDVILALADLATVCKQLKNADWDDFDGGRPQCGGVVAMTLFAYLIVFTVRAYILHILWSFEQRILNGEMALATQGPNYMFNQGQVFGGPQGYGPGRPVVFAPQYGTEMGPMYGYPPMQGHIAVGQPVGGAGAPYFTGQPYSLQPHQQPQQPQQPGGQSPHQQQQQQPPQGYPQGYPQGPYPQGPYPPQQYAAAQGYPPQGPPPQQQQSPPQHQGPLSPGFLQYQPQQPQQPPQQPQQQQGAYQQQQGAYQPPQGQYPTLPLPPQGGGYPSSQL